MTTTTTTTTTTSTLCLPVPRSGRTVLRNVRHPADDSALGDLIQLPSEIYVLALGGYYKCVSQGWARKIDAAAAAATTDDERRQIRQSTWPTSGEPAGVAS